MCEKLVHLVGQLVITFGGWVLACARRRHVRITRTTATTEMHADVVEATKGTDRHSPSSRRSISRTKDPHSLVDECP